MHGNSFDRLARAASSRAHRRAALGAVAASGLGGLFGMAAIDEAAAKCSQKKPCGLCRRCKKKKCKRQPDDAACGTGGVCQSGACVCPDQRQPCAEGLCCAMGQACFGGECEACGASGIDPCSPPVCGRAGNDAPCFCTVSVEVTPACVQFDLNDCRACTTNADCTTYLGTPAVCVDLSEHSCANAFCQETGHRFCMPECA